MLIEFFNFDSEQQKIKDELYEMHLKCVKNISDLFKELKLDNVHMQFYVYCYLLWNGYFSIDKTYAYNNRKILDENNTIFLGRGCCRHNANLLVEILNNLGTYARKIGLKTTTIQLNNLISIEQNVEQNEETQYGKMDLNHDVTLIKEKNNLFLLDPTMLSECEIIKGGKIQCFNGKYKVDEDLLKRELLPFLLNFNCNKKTSMNSDKLMDYYMIAEEICSEKTKLFDDFHSNNYHNYEKVKELVLYKK